MRMHFYALVPYSYSLLISYMCMLFPDLRRPYKLKEKLKKFLKFMYSKCHQTHQHYLHVFSHLVSEQQMCLNMTNKMALLDD